MTPMLETQLTVDDMADFARRASSRPAGREMVNRGRFLYLALLVLGGIGPISLLHETPVMAWSLLALVAAVGVLIWVKAPASMMKGGHANALKLYPSGVLPPTRLWLDAHGLNTASSGVSVHYSWTSIREIDETPTHVFVWVSERQAVIIPRGNAEQPVGAFVEALRAALEHSAPSWQAAPGPSDPRSR